MTKPVWFPFYVNDFLSSSKVTLMSNEERGGYILLLCHEWNDPHCSLPDDDVAVRKLSQLIGDLTLIKSCFIRKRGRLINERLYSEWVKVKEKSDLAKKSSEMRWASERDANALRTDIRTQSSSHRNRRTSEQKNKRTSEPSESQSKEVKSCTKAAPRATADTWDAYCTTYARRYGVPPIRNLSTNSQIKSLCARVPLSVAPAVAAYYVQHNDPFYVRARHPVGLLLRDCEGLHTQMASGVRSTTGEARNAEQHDEFTAQVKRVEAILKGGMA